MLILDYFSDTTRTNVRQNPIGNGRKPYTRITAFETRQFLSCNGRKSSFPLCLGTPIFSPPKNIIQGRMTSSPFSSVCFLSSVMQYCGRVLRQLTMYHSGKVVYLVLIKNRKHVSCFYRVIQTRVEVWENEKCCGNTSRRRVFPQLFRVLPNFHECLNNSIETRYMFSISFRK